MARLTPNGTTGERREAPAGRGRAPLLLAMTPAVSALCGAFLCALSCALVAPQARAGVPDTFGLGARSSAMAGAVGADATDFSAGYYNPAGLAFADGISLSAGYAYFTQQLLTNGADNGVEAVHGLGAGAVVPGRIGGVPVAFGVTLHLPDDGLSYLKARRQEAPRWELYDTRQQLLFLAANLAVRPLPWLAVGGGIGYLSATRGSFGIRGRAELVRPFDSALEHTVDAELTAVRFPLAGVRAKMPGLGALAVTYRGKSQLDLALDARLEGIVDFAGIEVPLLYALEARTKSSFTPEQLSLAMSVQRIAHLTLDLELAYVAWSGYESPTAQIVAELDVDAPPGTPVELPAKPAPTKVLPPGFRDRLVPRLGAEWRVALGPRDREVHGERVPLLEALVRAGYAFEASPVPEQRGSTSYLDADRHVVTFGAGLALHRVSAELPGTARLDVHGLVALLPERATVKASPADLTGDYRVSGTQVGGGAALSVDF